MVLRYRTLPSTFCLGSSTWVTPSSRAVSGISCMSPFAVLCQNSAPFNPNRKIFEARKRETAALGAGEKLVLGHPLAATIGDSARCMQNLEKVLFTGPKTSDTVTFICD